MLQLDDNSTFFYDNDTNPFRNQTMEGDLRPPLECPVFSKDDIKTLNKVTFWVDGVVECVIAFAGLIANIISALILNKEDMRNSFNFLLIALICMDSCYLIGSILESFRKGLDMVSVVHVFMFPYFLYPLLSIAVTGSIFMTVAIAFERYIAVHYPIDYSQAINSPEACKKRLFKYVGPVVLFSTLINIPKFFESKVHTRIIVNGTKIMSKADFYEEQAIWEDEQGYSLEEVVSIEHHHSIAVTELRKNIEYTTFYTNWTRLIVIGIIPTVLLIYFNYKIYKDVVHRNRRQMSMSRTSATATQQARRKQEDNLAVVFMGIVLVFLFCHAPRNLLSIAEMVMIERSRECQKLGEHSFPVWVLITTSFSHLLLIVNSSTNMILYIFLNKNFRAHFISMVRSTSKFLCRMYPFRRFRNNNTNETPDFEIHSLNGGHKEANGTNNALDENKDGIGHSPGCNGETAITMVSPQTPHQNNLVAPAPPPPPPGSGSGAGGAAASSPTGNGNNEAAKKSNQLTVPGAKSPIKEPAAAAQQWTTPVKSDSTASATPDSGQKPTPV